MTFIEYLHSRGISEDELTLELLTRLHEEWEEFWNYEIAEEEDLL